MGYARGGRKGGEIIEDSTERKKRKRGGAGVPAEERHRGAEMVPALASIRGKGLPEPNNKNFCESERKKNVAGTVSRLLKGNGKSKEEALSYPTFGGGRRREKREWRT